MVPSPSDNFGRDNSDPLFEEAKAKQLEAIEKPAEDDKLAHVNDRVQDACGRSPSQLLSIVREAEAQSTSYLTSFVKAAWERSYKAYRNEHFATSKYQTPRYRSRSKLFRPKTRSAVRKNMASAASALFATVDAVQVTAQDTGDPIQLAAASIKHELLNYRLDRTSGKNAIPWFLTAMGAHQSAQISGICCSKQFWIYEEDEDGKRLMDRPECVDIAPENVLLDPNADWRRPAQSAGYLILRWPLAVWEIQKHMRGERQDETQWLQIDEKELESIASAQPNDAMAVRRAREGGSDSQQAAMSGPFRIVWCYENFIRIDGVDYSFWTLGKERLLSIPRPVAELYPAFDGERPVVIGYGAIEAHRVFPMSPVESWQPLQQEANDVANLRLDQMKHVVNPVAKVRRGRQVDLEQVQRRSPDGVLLLQDVTDVEWDRPPDVPASAYQEANYINADLDELAGAFSMSSVQSNRQMNETVGGMKLMSGAAGSVTEFDLRVWIETWVEPVMWQLLRLIEIYEDDPTVLAIAGEKAQLYERFKTTHVTEEIIKADVTLRVSVGLGNSDPMQGLAKLSQAAQIAGNILGPFVEMGVARIRPNTKEIVNEVFGKAGYKDAGERFFYIEDESQPPQPKGEEGGGDGEAKLAAAKLAAETKAMETQAKLADAKEEREAKYADKIAERELKVQLTQLQAQLKMQGDLINKLLDVQAQTEAAQRDRDYGLEDRVIDRQFGEQDRARDEQSAQQERQAGDKQARQQRVFEIMQRDKDAELRRYEVDTKAKSEQARVKAMAAARKKPNA
jgi:hypothetical protein